MICVLVFSNSSKISFGRESMSPVIMSGYNISLSSYLFKLNQFNHLFVPPSTVTRILAENNGFTYEIYNDSHKSTLVPHFYNEMRVEAEVYGRIQNNYGIINFWIL